MAQETVSYGIAQEMAHEMAQEMAERWLVTSGMTRNALRISVVEMAKRR